MLSALAARRRSCVMRDDDACPKGASIFTQANTLIHPPPTYSALTTDILLFRCCLRVPSLTTQATDDYQRRRRPKRDIEPDHYYGEADRRGTRVLTQEPVHIKYAQRSFMTTTGSTTTSRRRLPWAQCHFRGQVRSNGMHVVL